MHLGKGCAWLNIRFRTWRTIRPNGVWEKPIKQNQNDMDTTKTVTHVSLCAGYGGIDLGLRRAIPSLRTIAFSEIESFACANLVSKIEAGLLDVAPIWTDVKTFPYGKFHGLVDILSGGYPCQPFSAAGNRLGGKDPRHLWPFIADGIRAMRPKFCFLENVEGHITLGLSSVISDLEEMGYRATWGLFSAAEIGAPHQRKRIFILAHAICTRLERDLLESIDSRWIQREVGRSGYCVWPSKPKQPQGSWEPNRTTQPKMGGGTDGDSDRVGNAELHRAIDSRCDELRLLGNGVVPECAANAFLTLLKRFEK